MREPEMAQIAQLIARTLRDESIPESGAMNGAAGSSSSSQAELQAEVADLCARFTPYDD